MEFDLENPLTNHQELNSDTLNTLFFTETDHMPTENYLLHLQSKDFDFTIRNNSVSLILQFSCNFEPFLSYLAVNYLDRYLSSQRITEAKPWMIKLLAVSCVSLAAKMMKAEVSLSDFQCEEGFIFDTQTIERMEFLILGALNWRMRSITPFSFVQFFISLFKLKDPPFTQTLKARAIEIIFKAQNEIKLLEFKPSIIAASALLSASHELFPLQFPCFRKAISNCSYVNKENMLKCYKIMEDREINGYETASNMNYSSSDTPINVLDRHYSSSESVQERDMKRRRIIELCKDDTFQLSQTQHC